jgi:nucleotide-binding universal stress UspA family protein
VVRDAQVSVAVIESLLIAVDAAQFADRVASWLPDLVSAGVRRATLFHAIEGVGAECVKELDNLRPRLDRLAVQLSAREVEADIALKRGDRVRWLTSLAELRTCQVLVLGAHCTVAPPARVIGSTLQLLLEESHIPLLIITRPSDATAPRLFERPYLLTGGRYVAALESRARALVPVTLHSTTLGAGEVIPPGASLIVTGPEPSGDAFERLISQSSCPVLVFPAPSLAVHPEKGPSTVTPPSEASGAARKG